MTGTARVPMNRSRTFLVIGGAVLAMAVGGCASSDTNSASVPVPSGPPATARASECASIYQGAFVSRIPNGTDLASVTVCQSGNPAKIATSSEGLDQLLTGLTANDEVLDPGAICTMEVRVAPDFIVTTASGEKIAAIIPTDVCGKPRLDVVQFLRGVS